VKHFLISDAHLTPEGTPHPGREPLHAFLRVLAKTEPQTLWILGDLFDFWFEYSKVIPAGYGGVLCRLRELSDAGWTTNFIPGNHDWWVGKHFSRETGMTILRQTPLMVELAGMRAVLAHGDGLGRGDWGYRAFKPVLRAGISRVSYSMLHPTPATAFAMLFSDTSRKYLRKKVRIIPRHLRAWAGEQLETCDLVVAGHTHVPSVTPMAGGLFVSLGDWISSFTYLKVEEGIPSLERFEG
jgi:UDP-2,3-diacylglucosamine hydrolase